MQLCIARPDQDVSLEKKAAKYMSSDNRSQQGLDQAISSDSISC